MMNSREAAYQALWKKEQGLQFLSVSLEQWKQKENPSPKDFHLAQEIAFGTERMQLSLDYLAKQLFQERKVSLKLKERILLRTALYQYYFMERIPLYAIVNETMKIAKSYCHHTFLGFLNAILRKLSSIHLSLPQGKTIEALSIRYSYPPFFIQELIDDFKIDQTIEILAVGNCPPKIMARIRKREPQKIMEGLEILITEPCTMAIIKETSLIAQIALSQDYYIQNVTPAYLIGKLCLQTTLRPDHVLDLCASPGGKLLAFYDFFPQAHLHANDVSLEKVQKIEQNLIKYQIKVDLSCSQGEEYLSDERFDVIIIDAPCSNSGVLNKRPEARWRLTPNQLEELERTQLSLIKHAKSLLSPKGEIWYMTCSILKRENEQIVKKCLELFGLKCSYSETILPNELGWDGGFASCFRLS